MMNKQELITAISENAGMTKKDTDLFLKAFQEVVMAELVKGEKVALTGFITFEVVQKAARMGRNPATGMEISIPEKKAVRVKIGKTLKDSLK